MTVKIAFALLSNMTFLLAQQLAKSCTPSTKSWSPLSFSSEEDKMGQVQFSNGNTCFELHGECLRLHFCMEEQPQYPCELLGQYRTAFACQEIVYCRILVCHAGSSRGEPQFTLRILKLASENNSTDYWHSSTQDTIQVNEKTLVTMFYPKSTLSDRFIRWLTISAVVLLCALTINAIVAFVLLLKYTSTGRRLLQRICPVRTGSHSTAVVTVDTAHKADVDSEPVFAVLHPDEFSQRFGRIAWQTSVDETDSQLPTYQSAVRIEPRANM